MSIFGLKISILKLTSWIFITLAIILFYKAYHKRISPIIMWGSIFALVVNHHFLFFGSQTYSEAFFMMLQSVFLLYLFRTIELSKSATIKTSQSFIIALILFLLILTRTVAIAALPALIIYLIIKKEYRATIVTTLFLFMFAILYIGAQSWLTETKAFAGSDQVSTLLYKNPYDQSDGLETAGGFFIRFVGNSNIYLSKYFTMLAGFKPAMSLSKQPLISVLLYLLFIIGIIRFYKKNTYLFFTGLYLAFMLGVTFFSLQTLWDQIRLIIPFYPLMLIFLLETIHAYTCKKESGWMQKIPVIMLFLSIILTTGQTIKQTDFTAIFKNMRGDKYYGYTPDWQNYFKMIEYTSKELPAESYVACRKPNMARIYAKGKKYYGIYRYDSENPDSLIAKLYNRDVTHVIAASLRKNPRVRTGQIINTIHRYITIIRKKYPEAFIFKEKVGKNEPALLFEINYETWLKNSTESTKESSKTP
jgi:hypothetical protein